MASDEFLPNEKEALDDILKGIVYTLARGATLSRRYAEASSTGQARREYNHIGHLLDHSRECLRELDNMMFVRPLLPLLFNSRLDNASFRDAYRAGVEDGKKIELKQVKPC